MIDWTHIARLVELVQNEDAPKANRQRAFGELVRHCQDLAYGTAFALLGDFHLAEDVAQEAFLVAYEKLDSLKNPQAFPAWLRRVVQHQCSRIMRTHRDMRSLEDVMDIPSDQPDPSDLSEQKDLQDLVRTAILSLPQNQRTVTSLFYITGYTTAQIARILDITEATCRKRLQRARETLKGGLVEMLESTLPRTRPSNDANFTDRVMNVVKAASEGDLEWIVALLDEDPNLLETDVSQFKEDRQLGETGTPLHMAAWFGHTRVAHYLLDRGAFINARDQEGRTPLNHALEAGGHEMRDLLIERGAEIDICSAAFLGDEKRLREILDANPDEANDTTTGLSALGWAAFGPHREDVVEILIEYGADVKRPGSLFAAASVNNAQFLRVMLERGADPNASRKGKYLLHRVAEMRFSYDSFDVARLLLEKGADVNVKDSEGVTPLDVALAVPKVSDDPHPAAPAQKDKDYGNLVDLFRDFGGKTGDELG